MSATVLHSPPAARHAAADDTDAVTRFLHQQLGRIKQASAGAGSPEAQGAVYGALVDELAHLFAGALGTLISGYGDPEAALGALMMTVMTTMQDQRNARRT